MNRCIVALLSLVAALSVAADDRPSEAAVIELLEVTEADTLSGELIEQFYQMLEASSARAVAEADHSPESHEIMHQANLDSLALMREHITWQAMKDDMIAIYVQHFTQSEVDAMIEFYRSETGQAINRKMPLVMQASMQLGEKLVQQIVPELNQIHFDALRELAQASQDTSAEP
jgi:uncharacterized protein